MKVSTGSDHRGVEPRKIVRAAIESAGHESVDVGSDSTESCDYPDFAVLVCEKITGGTCERGILVCGSGIGMSIAANKVDGIRAALCYDVETARLSRQHNDANVLCLPSEQLKESDMQEMITVWLKTDFEGGRHARRVEKMMAIEKS